MHVVMVVKSREALICLCTRGYGFPRTVTDLRLPLSYLRFLESLKELVAISLPAASKTPLETNRGSAPSNPYELDCQ